MTPRVALLALLAVLLNGVCWCAPAAQASTNATARGCCHPEQPRHSAPAPHGDSNCPHCAPHQLSAAEPGGVTDPLPAPSLTSLLPSLQQPVLGVAPRADQLPHPEYHAPPWAVRQSTCVLLL